MNIKVKIEIDGVDIYDYQSIDNKCGISPKITLKHLKKIKKTFREIRIQLTNIKYGAQNKEEFTNLLI